MILKARWLSYGKTATGDDRCRLPTYPSPDALSESEAPDSVGAPGVVESNLTLVARPRIPAIPESVCGFAGRASTTICSTVRHHWRRGTLGGFALQPRTSARSTRAR